MAANRAGRYRGSGREWSGSQARDKTGEVSRGPDQAVGSARTGTGNARNNDTRARKKTHIHQGRGPAGLAIP
ncbi:unnamed protein product [Staurois parvus]|uniref:Uncharacterized protein n=1 Tax=Staurois parvus TaxID=386267 RepID=A0ABN9AUJ7_9NEOB|nr:unnamed protein product [Staurois parvus]